LPVKQSSHTHTSINSPGGGGNWRSQISRDPTALNAPLLRRCDRARCLPALAASASSAALPSLPPPAPPRASHPSPRRVHAHQFLAVRHSARRRAISASLPRFSLPSPDWLQGRQGDAGISHPYRLFGSPLPPICRLTASSSRRNAASPLDAVEAARAFDVVVAG